MPSADYMREYRSRAGKAEAHRAMEKRRRDSRRRLIQAIKVTAGCADCGYDADPSRLHFDHVDPNTKEFKVGWVSAGIERLLCEVMKTVVRCAECHTLRHQGVR